MTYIDPMSGIEFNSKRVTFTLIRTNRMTLEYSKVDHLVDLHRNRLETAFILDQAVQEKNYQKSRDILTDQIRNIKKSVSFNDPFCQLLVEDLQQNHQTERDFRLLQRAASLKHYSERHTFSSRHDSSTFLYQSPSQRFEITRFEDQYT